MDLLKSHSKTATNTRETSTMVSSVAKVPSPGPTESYTLANSPKIESQGKVTTNGLIVAVIKGK